MKSKVIFKKSKPSLYLDTPNIVERTGGYYTLLEDGF